MSPELGSGGIAAEIEKLGLRPEPEFEEETYNYRIAGYATQDRMKGFLLLEKKQEDLEISPEDVLQKIADGGIVAGVDESAVRRCVSRAAGRKNAQLMEIARGMEPEDGLDGEIEFYVNPSSEEARYKKDASGRVNYHELNLIENVSPDQEVARILPPRPGVAGSDVLGEVIPSKSGEPSKSRAGKGIRADQNGELFVAEIPGRVVFEQDVISISQEFEVKGDVDFSVGNITFMGKVTVTGEVLDDFNIKADMGIEIRGTVGNCQLETRGDVVLAGGMAGKGKGHISCHGTLRTRYLNEVNVEAHGDVAVERESYNSVIHTAGAYLSPKGKVVGGEIVALRGIEVGTAGSELGIATKMISGIDYRSAGKRREMIEKLDKLNAEIERISNAIGPLLADPRKVQGLPKEKKKAVLNLVSHLKEAKAEREKISGENPVMGNADGGEGLRQINAKEKVYTGVHAELGGCRLLLKRDATGPLTMVEDVGRGTVRIMPYHDMGSADAAAEDLEEDGAVPGS